MKDMTSYTTPPPYVVSMSSDGGSGPTTEAWQAFNYTDTARSWVSGNSGGIEWIQLDWGPGGERILRSYNVFCPPGLFFGLSPSGWRIEGTNDGINFFLLHRVSGVSLAMWTTQPLRTYLYTNFGTAYRYTRLTIEGRNAIAPEFRVTLNQWMVSALGNVSRVY